MEGLGTFLVTPEELTKKAVIWQNLVKQAQKAYDLFDKAACDTEDYFNGTAGTQFRAEIKKKVEYGKEALGQLELLTEKLSEIARVYEKAEGENKNVLGGN